MIDPDQFGLWMAEGATLDARQEETFGGPTPTATRLGALHRIRATREGCVYLDWERADVEIPPGSTTVETDLVAQDDGTTLPTYRGLEDDAADAHRGGWRH